MNARHHEFFIKLGALCAEYGAQLTGCGCCGSPSVDFNPGTSEPCYDHVQVDKDGGIEVDGKPLEPLPSHR